MKKKSLLAVTLFCSVIFSAVIVYEFLLWRAWDFSPYFISADRCLDNGGCWDAVDNVCRKDEENAQELCDRRLLLF